MNTSTDVGWQSDELMESFLLEVVAKVVGLGGAYVDVSHDQGVFLWVDKLPQMLGQSEEGLVLGPVDADDIHVRHVNLHQLKVLLPKYAYFADSHPFLDEGCKSFTTALARKVSSISIQLILLLLLFTFVQPGLLQEEDVTLHQHGIGSDVLHVLAKGAGVEGGDLQPRCFWIHPIAGISVNGDSVHPLGFFCDLVIHCDLLWVHCVHDVQLIQTLYSREHDVGHARLEDAGDINNQIVRFCHSLTLK